MWALPLLVAAAPADPPAPAWQGVWQGKVGTLSVRACVARDGMGRGVGAYYYVARLRPIHLEQAGGSRTWTEASGNASARTPAPRWTFDTVQPNRLSGTWIDGARRMPFALARVATTDDDPCESMAFHAARIRPVRVTSAPATLAGAPYRRLRFDVGPAFDDVSLASFALPDRGAAGERINTRLRKLIPAGAAGSDWFACVTGALASSGGGGDYAADVRPTLLSSHWVAASESVDYDCGGAHPDGGVTSLTFDRATGAAVDLHDWLTPAAKEKRDYGVALRPALRAVIVGRSDAIEADCRDPLAEAEFWDIGLSRTGLVFTAQLAHVVAACADPVTLPWATLTPWLSAAGRTGAASLANRRDRGLARAAIDGMTAP